MSRPKLFLNFLNGWELVNAAVEAHAAELPHLEGLHVKLQAVLEQTRSLSAQHSALTANKQEATKTLQRLIRQGEALVDVLRTAAREHYGNDSETLVEFGMQPFRGRQRAAGEPPVNPPPETPEAPSSTPTPEPMK